MSDGSQLQYLYACPCLCIWLSVILGKQMVIVIVIVMWERHLCAGMLLRWKQSKSVCLCLHHLAYWQTKSKRRRNANCCNWCLGYRVPQSSYIIMQLFYLCYIGNGCHIIYSAEILHFFCTPGSKCRKWWLVLRVTDDTLISPMVCRLANAVVHYSTDYIKVLEPDEANVLCGDFADMA